MSGVPAPTPQCAARRPPSSNVDGRLFGLFPVVDIKNGVKYYDYFGIKYCDALVPLDPAPVTVRERLGASNQPRSRRASFSPGPYGGAGVVAGSSANDDDALFRKIEHSDDPILVAGLLYRYYVTTNPLLAKKLFRRRLLLVHPNSSANWERQKQATAACCRVQQAWSAAVHGFTSISEYVQYTQAGGGTIVGRDVQYTQAGGGTMFGWEVPRGGARAARAAQNNNRNHHPIREDNREEEREDNYYTSENEFNALFGWHAAGGRDEENFSVGKTRSSGGREVNVDRAIGRAAGKRRRREDVDREGEGAKGGGFSPRRTNTRRGLEFAQGG